MSQKTIGSILLESGKISEEQAEQVYQKQIIDNARFGDTAIDLGFVTKGDVKSAISKQFDFSYLSPDDSSIDQCLISAFITEGPQVEAFKQLRSQLTFRWFEDNKSLVVCAPVSNCGSSYISANMAVLFAQSGKKTLLVDANFRHPSQHMCFRQKNQYGFSQVLADRLDLDTIVPVSGLNNLSVLFSGAIPPNPVELFERSNFTREHRILEQEYDIIIYDSPPINLYAETQLIASAVGGCLLVGKKGTTKIKDLSIAKRKIENANAVPVGVAVNEFKKKHH